MKKKNIYTYRFSAYSQIKIEKKNNISANKILMVNSRFMLIKNTRRLPDFPYFFSLMAHIIIRIYQNRLLLFLILQFIFVFSNAWKKRISYLFIYFCFFVECFYNSSLEKSRVKFRLQKKRNIKSVFKICLKK